jgi:hypothetical protein
MTGNKKNAGVTGKPKTRSGRGSDRKNHSRKNQARASLDPRRDIQRIVYSGKSKKEPEPEPEDKYKIVNPIDGWVYPASDPCDHDVPHVKCDTCKAAGPLIDRCRHQTVIQCTKCSRKAIAYLM